MEHCDEKKYMKHILRENIGLCENTKWESHNANTFIHDKLITKSRKNM